MKEYKSCTEFLLDLLWTIKTAEYNFHQMHRNCWGLINKNFHERMQELYELMQNTEDIVAERAAQLWEVIPQKLCDVINRSCLEFIWEVPEIQEWIKLSSDVLYILAEFIKRWIACAIEMKDYHTEDILRTFCWEIETHKWKLDRWLSKANTLARNNNKDEKQQPNSESDKDDKKERDWMSMHMK